FLPSTGTLNKHRIPAGHGVRVDAGVEEGQRITIDYDPMISKLCTYGRDRKQAMSRMLRALDEYEIAGCHNTIPFCQYVLQHEAFRKGDYDTYFVPDHFKSSELYIYESEDIDIQRVIGSLLKLNKDTSMTNKQEHNTAVSN